MPARNNPAPTDTPQPQPANPSEQTSPQVPTTASITTTTGATGAGGAAGAAGGNLPPVEGVELELTADAAIITVRALGVRRVELEGNHARIVVAPWEGVLMIDAALAGGSVAHGTASAGEAADVQLITTRATATTRVTSGNGGNGSSGGRTHGSHANPDDLHTNPYDTKPH